MSPQQKALNDKILSIVTIALLVLFALVITLLIVSEVNIAKRLLGTADTPGSQNRPLTTIEVDEQRLFLPSTNIIIDESNTLDLDAVAEPSMTPPGQTSARTPDRLPESPGAVTLSSNSSNLRTDVALVRSGAGVTPLSVSSRQIQSSFLQNRVIEGTVTRVDGDSLIIVTTQSAVSVIITNDQTRIMINGRRMTVNDIVIGDTLRVEGTARPDSAEIVANAIAITGKLELINTR